MAESSNHQTTSSRLGVKTAVGEIVEVQGGHIVRSTGRKDRHSKVCTAKGPRDRRVRLAAHTAIQFYDVQDRLGYDRPSKAVDWLIKKAKSAIDELAQLPAWHPTSCSGFDHEDSQQKLEEEPPQHHQRDDLVNSNVQDDLHHRGIGSSSSNPQMSSFLPPSMDSDVIADTIKSFFPMGASDENTSSSMQFQSFPTPDLMQRSSSHSQDLRLSLQSFQDPIMLHHQQQSHHSPSHHPSQHAEHAHSQGRVLLSGTPLGFDSAGGWPEHHQFQRLAAWNIGGDTASGSGGGAAAAASSGYYFNAPAAPQPLLQQLLGHNQFFSQRGPLQSSNSPSVRAWVDPPSAVAVDLPPHHHPMYPSSVPGIGFASGYGGFTGFHIPARIQGDEEEHDGYSDKPSSASSDSRH